MQRRFLPNPGFTLLLVCLLSTIASAERSTSDYDHVIKDYFWGDLYSEGGWSLYCGYHFNPRRKTGQGRIIEAGHIYPIDWMLEEVDCDNRLQCFEVGHRIFMEMQADLHNIYPVWQTLVTMRGSLPFGEVPGEEHRYSDCDIEWDSRVLEPRPIARGNIARAVLYMHDRYQLPVTAALMETLKAWNRADPPSSQEQYRNDRIDALQGRRNPYIDNPALAEEAEVTTTNP